MDGVNFNPVKVVTILKGLKLSYLPGPWFVSWAFYDVGVFF